MTNLICEQCILRHKFKIPTGITTDFIILQVRMWILVLLITIKGSTVSSQTQKLDSLNQILPFLQDTAKADCLNELSYHYTYISKKLSAVYFQALAYQQSKRLKYIHGIAEAISRQAGIAERFENNFVLEEKLAKEALGWFEKTSNKRNIIITWYQLAFCLFAQGYYDEAISYVKKILQQHQKEGNELEIDDALSFIAYIYVAKGAYDTGFEYMQQSLKRAIKAKDSVHIRSALTGIGQVLLRIESYQAALNFYRQSLEKITVEDSIHQAKGEYDVWAQMEFAEVYCHLGLYDSALFRYNLFDSARASGKDLRVFLVSKGEYYLMQHKYIEALGNLFKGLNYHKKVNDRNEIMRVLLDISKIFFAIGNNIQAMNYGRQGLNMALQTNAKQFIRDGYEILFSFFERMHQTDSAYLYYRNYIEMKDAVMNDKIKGRFAAYNYEQRLAYLDEDKQLQHQKLLQTAQQRTFLIVIILVVVFSSVLIFRFMLLKRKNEIHLREKAENELEMQKLAGKINESVLRQETSELEMKALRAQINPHFIFNSLNSINCFIIQNNKAQASEYLTKFSRLVRMILQNSQAAFISLESELESLRLYLELEAVRFDQHFAYEITVGSDLDISAIKVPPLVIQPYAENAIWHGLMHREQKGLLKIELFQKDNLLHCRITDDGIGRTQAKALKSKSAPTYKSMGMQITASRIELLQDKKAMDNYIKISDLVLPDGTACGTEVLVKFPICYD